tara:strand:+ start:508 stop:780 length:273 start_codon:yes stop_codon:yes gene_type:complete
MNAYERAVVSLLTGISTGAFLGCFYGWVLLSLNAENLLNSNISNELDFFIMKTWMMGISIAGFVSIMTYYSGWILEKINEPTELKTITLD